MSATGFHEADRKHQFFLKNLVSSLASLLKSDDFKWHWTESVLPHRDHETGEVLPDVHMRRRNASGIWEYRRMTTEEEADYVSGAAW